MFRRVMSNLLQRLKGLPPIEEGEISAEILRACVTAPSPTIVEIGAHNGAHTGWMKGIFPNAVIHCFEPDPRAVQSFRQRTEEYEGVFLHEMVVSNRVGQVEFYPSLDRMNDGKSKVWDCSGSTRRPTGHRRVHPDIQFGEPTSVASTTLDQWCEEWSVSRIDLIWMDVQGAELDVFAGASASLSRVENIYTEYSVVPLYEGAPTLPEIMTSLHGFRPTVRFLNDILFQREDGN